MIKLKAEIDGRPHDLQLRRVDAARWSAEIDGRSYNLQLRNPAPGEYLIQHGAAVYNCRIETGSERNLFVVHTRGADYAVGLVDPKRLRSAQSAGPHDHGEVQIIAPMPGKVVRLLVEVGAQIEAGAGVVIVEAMKMQNEMKAPKAGVVVSLNVETGVTVNAGDVLAVIE